MTQVSRLTRIETAPPRSFGVPSFTAISPESRLDIQYCALLLALTAIMVLPGSLSLPMSLWDESRNANSAIEMAKHGDWMVTTFGYVPDHWNTKPPLLVWIMAALLRTGLDPMLAIRLPSVAATMGSVLLVYFACRVTIQDRMAGLLAGLFLTSSLLFMGDHVGRTGDYDALLSLLCLGFVLCAGRYIDAPRDRSGKWIAAGGALLFLAIMTKGVAAGMAVPGLLAYVIARRRFLAIARDWHLWASVICVAAGVISWLALRERFDPGYLAATIYNDVGGRFLTVLDQHSESPWYYLTILFRAFEPGMLLLPTLLAVRHDQNPARRQLCLLMTLTAVSWLITISCAESKCYWYVAPAVPLLAIAAGAGTTSFLRRQNPPLRSRVVLRPIMVAMLITFWFLNIHVPDASRAYAADQVWYGAFLDKIRPQVPLDNAVILDLGLHNDAGFQNYNPVARFFAEDAGRRGEHIQIATPGTAIANDATVITCDPRVWTWLKSRSGFTAIQSDTRCVVGRMSGG
jgi:4-amino-4-deoxy-L-arabinose transferase-like glycosyltransferase